jgi:hypothetical protein
LGRHDHDLEARKNLPEDLESIPDPVAVLSFFEEFDVDKKIIISLSMQNLQRGISCGRQVDSVSRAMARPDDPVNVLVFRYDKNGSHLLLQGMDASRFMT